ncbi:flagellar assembly protein FliH [Shewanella gaetbuli]|uniref:Flagellar assembly protein FliH n=1 Tax=Shewanella gaetbuli TaxID=220752 RepID=A0A9X1ZHL9_9GAMM|nr:flagellar assembly protein FliH [Shewanella gaetbuli]MCL1141686.1 flagellar assembly protein FliH [Shewanella gaetbuli]
MTDSKVAKKVLQVEDDHEFSHWHLPDVTENEADKPSNLFGKHGAAYKSDRPKADLPPQMPTMAEIEAIRADAEREGFEQGQQQGLQQGLEQGRLEGLAQGHQEGFAQGEQQGYEAGMTKAEELMQQFSGLINQFEQPLVILDTEVEAEVVSMAISMAKAVIQQELKTHPEHIVATIRHGVDALPIKEQKVKIRLHPDDANLVTNLYGQQQLQQNDWFVEIDPSLSQGDVFIESLRSSVNLSVAQRTSQIFSGLEAQLTQLHHQVQENKQAGSVYTTAEVDDPAQEIASLKQRAVEDSIEETNTKQSAQIEAEVDVEPEAVDATGETVTDEVNDSAKNAGNATIDEMSESTDGINDSLLKGEGDTQDPNIGESDDKSSTSTAE